MSQNTSFLIPPWVSSRTYVTPTEARSIIINERSRDLYTLEEESAKLWGRLEEGATLATLRAFAEELGVGEDLDEFLESLAGMDVLQSGANSLAEPVEGATAEAPAAKPGPTPEPSHQRIEDEFADWVLDQGGMWSLFYETTYRCNERCLHCFNPGAAHSDQQKPNRNTAELSTDEALAMIDEAYAAGVFKICLSGGEVLVRKDFFDLVEHIRRKRMSLTIYTNGLLLDDDKLERLAALYPALVGMSVYSVHPDIHDGITKVPGSHRRTVAALRQLNARGIRTALKAATMAHAVQGWQLLKELAEELGAFFQMELAITAGNDGAREPMQLNVRSHAELVALAVTEGTPMYVGDPAHNHGRMTKPLDQPVCGAGRRGLSINPEGEVFTCVALPMAVSNLRHESLAGLWRSSRYGLDRDRPDSRLSRWQDIKLRNYHECGTHERCAWCHKCPGMGFVETGDPLAASEVQCRIAAAKMDAAQRLMAGETRAAILESLGVPEDFGRSPDVRPLAPASRPITATIDPRDIGGRTFDGRQTAP